MSSVNRVCSRIKVSLSFGLEEKLLMIDNTYVVAFSMMMLHTDAFNKHNKNKMSKADYVRNTRMEGVSPLVLEVCFHFILELMKGVLR
jgi:Sec7-like guanine-nucleotide exchange factor